MRELRVLREEFVELSQTVRKLDQRLNTTWSFLSDRLLLLRKFADEKTQDICQEVHGIQMGLEENVRRYGVIRTFAQQMCFSRGEDNEARVDGNVNTSLAGGFSLDLNDDEEHHTGERKIAPTLPHFVHVSGETNPSASLPVDFQEKHGESRKRSPLKIFEDEGNCSKRQRTL